jgi:hypothetical protein
MTRDLIELDHLVLGSCSYYEMNFLA